MHIRAFPYSACVHHARLKGGREEEEEEDDEVDACFEGGGSTAAAAWELHSQSGPYKNRLQRREEGAPQGPKGQGAWSVAYPCLPCLPAAVPCLAVGPGWQLARRRSDLMGLSAAPPPSLSLTLAYRGKECECEITFLRHLLPISSRKRWSLWMQYETAQK